MGDTMRILTIGLVTATALALSACGTSTGDRALSGGAIGAAAGAGVGLLVSGIAIVPATIVGAAIGAGTGALTNSNQIDFGKPVWRQ
jgi:osmotically inducible lipoprotein OsmB